MIDKSLILNKIRLYLNIKSDTDFAKYLGVNRNVLSNWKARNTYDIKILTQKCDFLNPDWLLTGNGQMLKGKKESNDSKNSEVDYLNMKLELTNELLKGRDELIVMLKEKIKELESR